MGCERGLQINQEGFESRTRVLSEQGVIPGTSKCDINGVYCGDIVNKRTQHWGIQSYKLNGANCHTDCPYYNPNTPNVTE